MKKIFEGNIFQKQTTINIKKDNEYMRRKNETNKDSLEQLRWSKWWVNGHSNQWERGKISLKTLNGL